MKFAPFVLAAGWVFSVGVSSVSPLSRAVMPRPMRTGEASAPRSAQVATAVPESASQAAVLQKYCVTCHNPRSKAGGFSLDTLDIGDVHRDAESWEKVVAKLRAGVMPPQGLPRPDAPAYTGLRSWLEHELDRAAQDHPNPGQPAVRRLTASEYINSIRDLLALPVDQRSLLFPPDDVDQHGFQSNGDVLSVSPALFERYLVAANRISRLAVGDLTVGPGFTAATYSTPKLLYQDDRMDEELPFGSRGGMVVRQYLPVDGEYGIQIVLRRQIYDYVVGMGTPQQLDVRLDGVLIKRFTVGGADSKGYPSADSFFGTIRGDIEWEEYMSRGADKDLTVRFPAKAGMRVIGVSFANARTAKTGILERRRAGFALSSQDDYLGNAAIESVDFTGPYKVTGTGETPSRRRIFECYPTARPSEEQCARRIFSTLARRAYRRPVTDEDIRTLLTFYEEGRRESGFESGIQKGLQRLLVAPEFLFRIERVPADVTPGTAYRLSDLELASRLSFFVWSSIPDDELLRVAARGDLHIPAILEEQVRRMLADDKATALVDNFATQWLQLHRIRGVTPDVDLFYEFDENLRADMERETKLFVQSQIRGDYSLIELLTANYTFVNERLAQHYGIPNIYGERFRRVAFDDGRRGGLLGQASLLTVSSYPTRTSPVLRGKWVLDNLLGLPPPPPPPDVPALEENRSDVRVLSMRKRMEAHRANPACASCHRTMDPVGLALENYDAVGRWRDVSEGGTPIDASGVLADGTKVDDPATFRQALLSSQEQFNHTVIEKLLTYALGRELKSYDQPSVRRIEHDAAPTKFRWSSIILGIVKSAPFQLRRAES